MSYFASNIFHRVGISLLVISSDKSKRNILIKSGRCELRDTLYTRTSQTHHTSAYTVPSVGLPPECVQPPIHAYGHSYVGPGSPWRLFISQCICAERVHAHAYVPKYTYKSIKKNLLVFCCWMWLSHETGKFTTRFYKLLIFFIYLKNPFSFMFCVDKGVV